MKFNLPKKIEEITLLKNTSYLFVFQVLNSLLPLIILPYVIQSVSIEKYGVIVFVQTLVAYFLMLTEYGFNISTTKDIAYHKEDMFKVKKIFNTVLMAKLYLAGFGLLVFILLLIVFQSIFKETIEVYMYAYLLVFGMAISPTWLFQGFENMKVMVISNFLVKLLFVAAVLIFVKNENDFGIYILLNSLSYLLIGGILLFIAVRTYSVSFKYVSLSDIYSELQTTFHYFTSKISSTLYLNNNVFFLGLFGSVAGLGYYAIAEKVIRALLTLMSPLNQASLPYISRAFSKSTDHGILQSKKLLKYIFLGLLLFTIIINITAELIVYVLMGTENYDAEIVTLIRIMSPIPLLGIVGYFIAYSLLSNLGLMRLVPKVMIVAATINTILNFLLIPNYDAYGAAISILITEGFLLLMFTLIYKKWENQ